MMGYTHAVVGAAGAVMMACLCHDGTPEQYFLATVAGTLGGISADIDVKDNFKNPKVTEAIRTKISVLGLLVLAVVLDFIFKIGALDSILSRQYLALGGVIMFCLLLLIGYFTEHRTFTHSLTFVILTSLCMFFVYPKAVIYYSIGCLSHIILDIFNYKFRNHGVWLLFPLKIGNGIAFGLCKSGRIGNKVLYFIGLSLFLIASVAYMFLMKDLLKSLLLSILCIYIPIVMHFVRRKSEKEQRHIMHIKGEL